MPLIAIATLFNGIAAHYFDHALHLAKKTRLFFYTLGPSALLNFVGNLYAIPHFGIIGAAYTTLAAYALYLALSILIGRQVFAMHFPFQPALEIAVSTGVMALVLLSFEVPANIFGLVVKIAVGGAVYGAGILTFNVMDIRTKLFARLTRKSHKSESHKSESQNDLLLTYEILTEFDQAEAIAGEWETLHRSSGLLFGSSQWFKIWWRNLGKTENSALSIAVARTPTGELKAVLPLVRRKSGFLRMLGWAGADVFDYGDVVTDNPQIAEALWRFVCAKPGYDIALIKDVRTKAVSLKGISVLMQLREQRKNYFLTLDFASGQEWLAAQSRKLRGDVRRKSEKMEKENRVRFHVHQNGDPVAV